MIEAKLNDLVSLEEKSDPASGTTGDQNPVPSCRDDSRREVYHGDLFQCGGSSGCRRNIGNIFRDSDFLQARTVCSCVPVLLEMRWF